ncbi:MAG: AI-2E family transporter [Tannerella sp.]|nr:AI-2E family transporter [Tannerella sp.]
MKEKYFKYVLLSLVIVLGWVIISGLWPFVNGLLGAFTLYVLVRGQMKTLTEKRKMNKTSAALLIITEVIVIVFLPLYLVVWALVHKIQLINFDISQLVATVEHFISLIQDKTGYDILSVGNLETAAGYLSKGVQVIISQIGGIVVTTIVTAFLLFFMLRDREKLEEYIYKTLPFSELNKVKIRSEIYNMVRSNAIGIPLLAIIQGVIAVIGYLIAGVPSAMLFGVATAFATLIPVVGTGIVWLPLCIYLAMTGHWVSAIILAAWCALLLVNVDNLARLLIQRKLSDTHPLITVFGVILGLKLFGFWGIIFGPLLISLFFLLLNIFYKEINNE